jgi:NAD(P)-dependent dehydrogenase (short-subunit alcohol dehydrogenase family)
MPFSFDIQDRVAIVTGATSGIGQATALRMAAEGARVVAVGRNADKLRALAKTIKGGGGVAIGVTADLTKPAEAKRIVARAIKEFGGVDILVNAAGIIAAGTIENTTLEDWQHVLNVNTQAPFLLMQAAMPYLIERKGSIVNVASVNALRAFPNVLAYNVSKAAVAQLTYCASLEVAAKGVRVNAVCPGVTETHLHRTGYMNEEQYTKFLEHSKTTHPLGRVAQPEEVADLITFLASPKASDITGVAVPIDGGRSQTCAR